MFDVPTNIFDVSFIKIFVALTAVVYLIYRFQVIRLFFDEFGKWRKRENKNEADRLKFSRLSAELDQIINNDNIIYSAKTPPEFHLLKIIKTDTVYSVHLTVTGDIIKMTDIGSKDFKLISLEPIQLMDKSLSFSFRFSLADPEKKVVKFIILYEDQFDGKHTREYILFIREKILEELK